MSKAKTPDAAKVFVGTLCSRLLGAVRDGVIARHLVPSESDLFFVAFAIPNTLRVLLAEGAMSAALIPVLSETQAQRPSELKQDYAKIRSAFAVVLVAASMLGALLAPWIVKGYVGGYDAAKMSRTVTLTRIMFPYLFLMGMAALWASLLHIKGRFFLSAVAPSMLNIAMIVAVLLLPLVSKTSMDPLWVLSLSVIAGGVLHLCVQWAALSKTGVLSGFNPKQWFTRHDPSPAVKRVFQLLWPTLLTFGVYQANVLFSRRTLSYAGEGAQSYFYYAQRMVEIPQGLFALSLATASVPLFASLRSLGKHEEARKNMYNAFRSMLFVALPFACFFYVFAEEIMRVFCGDNRFGLSELREVSASLKAQSLGILFVSWARILIPAYHAYQHTKIPAWGSFFNAVLFVGMVTFVFEKTHVNVGHAIVLGSAAQVCWLLLNLRRITSLNYNVFHAVGFAWREWLAATGAGALFWVLKQQRVFEALGEHPWIRLMAVSVVSVAIYVTMLLMTRSGELATWFHAVKQKINR